LKALDSIKTCLKNTFFTFYERSLLSIKYWFSDFQNFFLSIFWMNEDFLSKINRFLRLPNFYVCRDFMAVHMKILSAWFLKDAFKLETSPFKSLKELRLIFIFDLKKQIPSGSSHTNFWLHIKFHVKYWPILKFFGLIW
jgi:hypothetical protein